MPSSSSSDSSQDETPRAEQIDFDFFDDEGDAKDIEKSTKTRVKSSVRKNSQEDLHGNGSPRQMAEKKNQQTKKYNHSDEGREQTVIKTYTSSTKVQIRRVNHTETVKNSGSKIRDKLTVHVPHDKVYTRSSNDSDSSDSVTDVSPLSSPGVTPRPNSGKHRKTPKRDAHSRQFSSEKEQQRFAADTNSGDNIRPHGRKSNGEAISIEDLMYSSDTGPDSSDERDLSLQKKKHVQRKKRSKYDEIQQRMEASSRHHRRRLLDVAAENSMDLSQLLEVVLEMEQENKTRRSLADSKASRNILPPPVKPCRKKNMSFSNDQVHDIDRENQRLLKRLAQLNTRQQRPSSASSIRSSASSCRSSASSRRSTRRPFTASSTRISPSRGPRTYHSATNRLRDQKRIERENLALLKRLQTAKPSSLLKRENLLRDYERQTGRVVEPMSHSSRRKQKASYPHYAECEIVSNQYGQRKERPAWQDSW